MPRPRTTHSCAWWRVVEVAARLPRSPSGKGHRSLHRPKSRRVALARCFALVALLATAIISASCGTHNDNTLGVALIEDRAELKAVRLVTVTADTSTTYQLLALPGEVPSSATLLVSARPGYLARTLIRFASSTLPPAGTVVDSARLDLPFREGFGSTQFSMLFHAVTESWTETVILPDSFPTFGPAFDSANVDFAEPLLDTLAVAVGSLVQSWVNDSTSNFGIALAPATGEDAELALGSRESATLPRLTVHWTIAGHDTSVSAVPVADVYSIATTPSFTPLDQEPRRLTVGCGFPSRSLVRFSWADLGPRATIQRAELTLHIDVARSSGRSIVTAIRRLTAEPWSGATTPVDPLFQANMSVSATAETAVFDVTSVLQQLLLQENHGFEIRAVDERPSTYFIRFHAHDTEEPTKLPQLQIWYTPGDVPEEAS